MQLSKMSIKHFLRVMPMFTVSIALLQDQKPCLLIWGTFHNYQSRYALKFGFV